MIQKNNVEDLGNHRTDRQEEKDSEIIKEAWNIALNALADVAEIMDQTPGKLGLDESRDVFFDAIRPEIWELVSKLPKKSL